MGSRYTPGVNIETIFFDLDDTLYPRSCGVWQMVRARIESYMLEQVKIPKQRIAALRRQYLLEYGTTLRGLVANHSVDVDDYLVYVHDIPLETMMRPSARLGRMLSALPQRKWVFTNASLAHARRVLAALGVSQHFEGIIDVKAMGLISKPDPEVYRLALDKLKGQPASASLFVDDQGRNLEPAKRMGAATVLVGTHEPHPAADKSTPIVEDLLKVMPSLVE